MGKKYQFQITVHPLTADLSEAERDTSALIFNVDNHDDILQIFERMRGGALFDKDTAAAFAVGHKLFTEEMLEHRDDPIFGEIQPAIGELMKKLKSGAKSQQTNLVLESNLTLRLAGEFECIFRGSADFCHPLHNTSKSP